jgi:heme oxygenase
MILSDLKRATSSVHARLEATLPLLAPDLTPTRYREVLVAFHGFYGPLEARLARHADALAEWGLELAERRKVPALERDLEALGLPRASLARMPTCASVPGLTDLPSALGSLYVVEGATLGGQLMVRHLSKSLPATEGARAFFASYGDRVGEMWMAFRGALETFAGSADTRARGLVVGAAIDTFTTLEAWLESRPLASGEASLSHAAAP